MPHIVIKMMKGRTEPQKQALATAVAEAVSSTLGCGDDAVSVAIEDVAQDAWMDDVYGPDIQDRADTIYKRPGYGSFK